MRASQSMNAWEPIVVHARADTDWSDVHPLNAEVPIDVHDGAVTFVIYRQSANELAPIDVTEYVFSLWVTDDGIVMAPVVVVLMALSAQYSPPTPTSVSLRILNVMLTPFELTVKVSASAPSANMVARVMVVMILLLMDVFVFMGLLLEILAWFQWQRYE